MASEREESVTRLPYETPPEPPPSAPGSLHGLAIAGMALCALAGIAALFAFITISWPDGTGRYVIGAFIIAGVGFLACASAAVLTAARDTYANRPGDD